MPPRDVPYSAVERAVLGYAAAWNEDDGAERRAILERCFAEHGTVISSSEALLGREALGARIARWRIESPGWRALFTSAIEHHHDVFRFAGALVASDDHASIPLVDIGVIDADGRIERIITFHRELAPPPQHWPASLVAR